MIKDKYTYLKSPFNDINYDNDDNGRISALKEFKESLDDAVKEIDKNNINFYTIEAYNYLFLSKKMLEQKNWEKAYIFILNVLYCTNGDSMVLLNLKDILDEVEELNEKADKRSFPKRIKDGLRKFNFR